MWQPVKPSAAQVRREFPELRHKRVTVNDDGTFSVNGKRAGTWTDDGEVFLDD